MPDIDYLLITHDHWDHLDYSTVVALQSKAKQVICPLGVGAHFEKWEYAREKIYETDWYNRVNWQKNSLSMCCRHDIIPVVWRPKT